MEAWQCGSGRASTGVGCGSGIYTDPDSSTVTRDNVRLLAPQLWAQVPESVRSNFGVRQARFKASLDQAQAELAREFLSAVDGLSYLSEDIRLGEIDTLLDELRRAHFGMDNSYNEPPIATRLAQIVGSQSVPWESRPSTSRR